jgi:hypothetical protein
MVKVVEILIKRVTVQLNCHNLLDSRVGYSKRFLETFEDPLAIPMRVLYPGLSVYTYKEGAEYTDSLRGIFRIIPFCWW